MNIDICRKCPHWNEILTMLKVVDADDNGNIISKEGCIARIKCNVTWAGETFILDAKKSRIVNGMFPSTRKLDIKRGDGIYEKLHDLLGDEYEQLLKEKMGRCNMCDYMYSRCEYHMEHIMYEWN